MDKNETVPVEFYHGVNADIPLYFENFCMNKAGELSRGLREGDERLLVDSTQALAGVLPKDASFRELAAVLARKKDGSLFITLVKGGIEKIDSEKAGDLLDDLVQQVPVDIEQLMLIHSHPCEQTPIGPAYPEFVSWSSKDVDFIKVLGGKLKIFPNLNRSYTTLVTANSRKVVLNNGENLGRAFGWKIPAEAGPVS